MSERASEFNLFVILPIFGTHTHTNSTSLFFGVFSAYVHQVNHTFVQERTERMKLLRGESGGDNSSSDLGATSGNGNGGGGGLKLGIVRLGKAGGKVGKVPRAEHKTHKMDG